jgi:molybdate transport system substrate-binding protein
MGNAPDAIPNRLARGEPVDVVIIAGEAIDKLIAEGKLQPGSRTDLVLSRIGVTVKSGAPRPDISTPEAIRAMLLEAPSIAYSASASGVYVSTEMFQKLGIADQVMPKARRVLSERVAAVVARGEAAVGFQQVSEILGVPGADYVGPLPDSLQRVTAFSAGLSASMAQPEAARQLVAFLRSPAAYPAIRSTGLDPAP